MNSLSLFSKLSLSFGCKSSDSFLEPTKMVFKPSIVSLPPSIVSLPPKQTPKQSLTTAYVTEIEEAYEPTPEILESAVSAETRNPKSESNSVDGGKGDGTGKDLKLKAIVKTKKKFFKKAYKAVMDKLKQIAKAAKDEIAKTAKDEIAKAAKDDFKEA
ncbi:hypothetical protein ACFE04_026438 [Oxalis oulophora]